MGLGIKVQDLSDLTDWTDRVDYRKTDLIQ